MSFLSRLFGKTEFVEPQPKLPPSKLKDVYARWKASTSYQREVFPPIDTIIVSEIVNVRRWNDEMHIFVHGIKELGTNIQCAFKKNFKFPFEDLKRGDIIEVVGIFGMNYDGDAIQLSNCSSIRVVENEIKSPSELYAGLDNSEEVAK